MRTEARTKKQEAKKALIIGVSNYTFFPTLNFCKKDGNEMVNILSKPRLGYEVTKLIGGVHYEKMRDVIRDFFLDPSIKSKDTLLFYFSGHGVLDRHGDNYLTAFETDPEDPGKRGVSFDELERVINNSLSTRIVAILDCCYGGAARLGTRGISKGIEDNAAKLGRENIERKIIPGKGKCILAACLGTQEAESTLKRDYSTYTYYLLEGLKGEAADIRGNITPDSLAEYAYDMITSLSAAEKPNQIPIKKIEAAGNIILAYYPDKIKQEKEVNENTILLKLLQQGKIAQFNKKHQKDMNRSIDLHGADLAKANLKGANLIEVNFAKADLEGANLLGVKLSGANLWEAYLIGADLIGADLTGADLTGANLWRAYLIGADLIGADLTEAVLIGADLTEANLTDAKLQEAKLKGASLEGANLIGADLTEANLTDAKLQEAKLKGADLRQTKNLPISKEEARERGAII